MTLHVFKLEARIVGSEGCMPVGPLLAVAASGQHRLMRAGPSVLFPSTSVVASSDLNPVTQGYLASPAAITRLKILTAKAIYIIAADDLQAWPKVQVGTFLVAGM